MSQTIAAAASSSLTLIFVACNAARSAPPSAVNTVGSEANAATAALASAKGPATSTTASLRRCGVAE